VKDFQRAGLDTKSLPRNSSWKEFRSWQIRTLERAGWWDYLVYLLLFEGDKERAIAILRKCVESNSTIVLVLYYPDFDPLRDDPQFAELVAKAQLPVAAYCQLPKKK
jgi:hypothetical protein